MGGEDAVKEFIRGLRHMNIAGITATKPNKVALWHNVDALDPLAERTGATNDSYIRDGSLVTTLA